MRTEDLIQSCKDSLARWHAGKHTSAPTLALVIPGGCSGNTKRLFGRKGPRGEVVSENEKDCIVVFNPRVILNYLQKEGLYDGS